MSFVFFRGEDIFFRGQFKVVLYLCNYVKLLVCCEEDFIIEYYDLNIGLDGIIQGCLFGKFDDFFLVSNLENIKFFLELGDVSVRIQEYL